MTRLRDFIETPVMRLLLALLTTLLFVSCSSPPVADGNLGSHPDRATRKTQIAAEPRGDFYYGRRYYVQKTRFWGYLRKPGQSAQSAKLVIFNESKKRNPDRFPEDGPADRRYGFDQNYEYKIYGNYTGRTLYEPNSNQILPEFMLTRYELVNKDPGWLFSPADSYSSTRVTLIPRF
ncbi:hypothetical protein N9085_02145 [Akkermansiaceae bacterium]|nr:hypothetical protein [Akkermansiaceae bacterium]MDB4585608.1 hypothetical protein [Akkermansiaceae bacterium]